MTMGTLSETELLHVRCCAGYLNRVNLYPMVSYRYARASPPDITFWNPRTTVPVAVPIWFFMGGEGGGDHKALD